MIETGLARGPRPGSADENVVQRTKARETTVAIIDDKSVVCESLAAVLSAEPELRVLGWASAAPQAIGLVEDLRPNVLVLSAEFSRNQGIDVLEQVHSMRSRPAIVLVLNERDANMAPWAARKGVTGFVLATSPVRHLIDSIASVANGQMWASPQIVSVLLQDEAGDRRESGRSRLKCLTPRESEVLQLLVEGLGYSAISDRLHLSFHTVRTHSHKLQKKLRVHSALQAVAAARESGLAPLA
jgi:DNA-binding NarL/FixJ family response regulator